jgi:hypothetical protein
MAYTSIWTYIWDLMEEGHGPVLRRFKEDLGLDALSVTASYHTCYSLSLRNPRRRFFVAPSSALYFQPERARYRDCGIEPYVSPWLGADNPIEQVIETSQQVGLDVGAWTCFSLNSSVCERYPECAAQNAFGDRSCGSLCVSNPRVRGYALALVGDLADNYGFSWLELEQFNFRSFEPYATHPKVGIDLDPIVDWLLAMCFCEHCAARTNARDVDFEKIRQTVQHELSRAFTGQNVGRGRTVEAYIDDTPGLSELVDLRTNSTVSLIRDLRAVTDKPLMFLYMQDLVLTGADPTPIAPVMEWGDLVTWTIPPDAYRSKVQDLRRRGFDDPSKLITTLGTSPNQGGRETLLADVAVGVELGVGGFAFYNYSMTPDIAMSNLRDACALAHGAPVRS